MDTAGDGFYATFDGPARAVRCALAIEADVRKLSIEVRAGVHTGEMQPIDGKVGGIAVALGARIASLAGPSEVLVSQTVGISWPDRVWCSKPPASTSSRAFPTAGRSTAW